MRNLHGKVQHIALALLLCGLPAEAQTVASVVDAVSDSALFSTIAGLQRFGTRYYLAGNALQVSHWVREQFLAAGLTNAVLDTFLCNNTPQANIVATLIGTRHPEREIIVSAHIDSRSLLPGDSAPGADDDASGTAAVLEIARVMVASGYRPSATIRFIGFAAEEPGLVGSSTYVHSAKAAGSHIILAINFDMIGYTTAADPERHFNIIYYPPDTETADLAASAATSSTSLKPVTTTVHQANVDSRSFAMEGFAAVTFIEYLDNPFYHKPADLIETLDRSYTGDITRAGVATILLFDGASTSAGVAGSEVASVAKLYQNYPNPFNPLTIIKYTIGGNGGWGLGVRDVSLVIYDVLGREVAVLVNETKQPGSYETRFDASGLASGVYVYRLTAGSPSTGSGPRAKSSGFVQSRKMALVK